MTAWLKLIPGWAWWLLALAVVAGGQQVRVFSAQSVAAEAQTKLSSYREKISERDRLAAVAAFEESQRRQAERTALLSRLADQDAAHYQELTDARQDNDRLSADLRATRQRLSVRTAGRCPAGVPAAAGAGRLDHAAERADIHPEDAAAIVRITGDADACAVKLTALQEWAREVSR